MKIYVIMIVEESTLMIILDIAALKRDTNISRLFQKIENTRKLNMMTLRKLETVQSESMIEKVDVADKT